MSIAQNLIAEFGQEVAATRRLLEAVPEDKLDWQPHEKSMTLGRLAGHIAESAGWVNAMMAEELNFGGEAAAQFEPFTATNRAELLATFDGTAAGYAPALNGKDDAFMMQTWKLKNGDKELIAAPRGAAIRSFTISHLIHHRGQLTVYLRLLGTPVPSTYGPTADFPDF